MYILHILCHLRVERQFGDICIKENCLLSATSEREHILRGDWEKERERLNREKTNLDRWLFLLCMLRGESQ